MAMARIEVTYRLPSLYRQASEGLWVTCCPALRMFSQGASESEARSALDQSVTMYLATCHRRGILDRELARRGLVPVGPGERLGANEPFIGLTEFPEGKNFDDAKPFDCVVSIDLAIAQKITLSSRETVAHQ